MNAGQECAFYRLEHHEATVGGDVVIGARDRNKTVARLRRGATVEELLVEGNLPPRSRGVLTALRITA